MQTHVEIFLKLSEQNARMNAEIAHLKGRLDTAVNTMALQRETIQGLRDEIAILKGQKPKPKIPPGKLGKGDTGGKGDSDPPGRGKSPRHKKTGLPIHSKVRITPESMPDGAIFKGLQKYTVQDITLRSHNTVYELERWRLPDGTYITGKLPHHVQGHYGWQLVSYVLHQYYGCRVTEPLLLSQLKEIGILISAGQLSNILTQNKNAYHQEKNALLTAGIAATGQIQADDTGARHRGQNGYSTVIENEYFTYIVSTDSKSRMNFLEILHGETARYLVNRDTLDYIESIKPSSIWLGGYLLAARDRSMSQAEWDHFLFGIDAIKSERDMKLATEAALFASLIAKGIPRDLGVHGDDAGQFNVFARSLCWVHEERHYRKLIPYDEAVRQAIEHVRGEIWELYKGLQQYKIAPCEELRTRLDLAFDTLFLKKETISETLNHQLKKTHAKKAELLRVLERPTTPIHNNRTETDAREMVVKRKISGGTRSAEGQKARDTFISLKKTCGKLGINFMKFLQDRVGKFSIISPLAEVIACRANLQPQGP